MNHREEQVELCTPNLHHKQSPKHLILPIFQFPAAFGSHRVREWRLPRGFMVAAVTLSPFCPGLQEFLTFCISVWCPELLRGETQLPLPTPRFCVAMVLQTGHLWLRLCFKGDHRAPKPSGAKRRLGFGLFSTILHKIKGPLWVGLSWVRC